MGYFFGFDSVLLGLLIGNIAFLALRALTRRVLLAYVVGLVVVGGKLELLHLLEGQHQILAEGGLAESVLLLVGSLRRFLGADASARDCVLVLGILHPLRYNDFIILRFVIILALRLLGPVVVGAEVGLGRELVV